MACCSGLYLIVVDSNGSSLCIQPEALKGCTVTQKNTHSDALKHAVLLLNTFLPVASMPERFKYKKKVMPIVNKHYITMLY